MPSALVTVGFVERSENKRASYWRIQRFSWRGFRGFHGDAGCRWFVYSRAWVSVYWKVRVDCQCVLFWKQGRGRSNLGMETMIS